MTVLEAVLKFHSVPQPWLFKLLDQFKAHLYEKGKVQMGTLEYGIERGEGSTWRVGRGKRTTHIC